MSAALNKCHFCKLKAIPGPACYHVYAYALLYTVMSVYLVVMNHITPSIRETLIKLSHTFFLLVSSHRNNALYTQFEDYHGLVTL